MPFQNGENVGAYRIIEQLGQGGMATVYKAYHATLDRHVAIKVLHPAFKEDENFFTRFKREAQIVAKLDHPNIVPIYDFAETGEPYIVMKFIEGMTLKHRIKQKPLTLEETLKIMNAVAAGLNYAHQRGILHRDVKPSNVMIDKDDMPYLADFGLARIASSGESTMSQDVLIGTPHYISPEQAKGVRTLGPETDIYAMGIMLYEIVVGRVPFSADTPYAIVHDHIYKPLPIPSQVNPSVPPQVETVLLKALAKEPSDRYPSAPELMDAFKSAIAEADMRELSATSIRMDKFEELIPQTPAIQTPTSTQDAQLNDYIKSVTREFLQSQLVNQTGEVSPVPAAIPSVGSSASARRRRARSRRNFWILSGFVALIFICIASLAVTIHTLQDPALEKHFPEEEGGNFPPPPRLTEEPVDISFVANMTVKEAQDWVDKEPDSAEAHMALAMAYLQERRQEEAGNELNYVLTNLNPSAELIAQAARLTGSLGYADQAIYPWFAAYSLDPTNPDIRNEAGQYVYLQVTGSLDIDISMLEEIDKGFPDSPLVKTMGAQAVISNSDLLPDARRTWIEDALKDALALNENFAEAYLVYGNYYLQIGDLEKAVSSWQYARSFTDCPVWVQREATLLIEQNQEN